MHRSKDIVPVMNPNHRRNAFTLIETLVAALLLSMAVVVLGGVGVSALASARRTLVDEQAWDLADRQLTMVDTIGVRSYSQSGPMHGTFPGDGVTFSWQLTIAPTAMDLLYDVTVLVRWTDQHRGHTIQVQTRLSGYE